MPNVNYRGNPSQDPNAPPESGMTSIPLGAPWPPLSREQVAELHQELVEFYAGMKRCVDLGINDSARAAYAERLTIVLHRLGIGSPPPTRTWTHEEVAKVAEEVQSFSDAQSAMDCIFATMPVKNVSGRELKAGEMVTTAQVQVEPPKRNCWMCKHAGLKSSRYGYKYATCRSPVDGASYWVTKQILDGEEMPPKDSDGCPGWERKP